MSVNGAAGLNVSNGKPSFISLLSSSNSEFSSTTAVTSVTDSTHGLSWTVAKSQFTGNILMIKVKGTKPPFEGDDPPTSGTVTVVTTSPACTVTTTAGYVDDPNP